MMLIFWFGQFLWLVVATTVALWAPRYWIIPVAIALVFVLATANGAIETRPVLANGGRGFPDVVAVARYETGHAVFRFVVMSAVYFIKRVCLGPRGVASADATID